MTHSELPKASDDRGAALVITVLVMLTIFVAAAFAIDTAIWFVHGRHLQTQADAAAFAGAHKMADEMINGNCTDSDVKSEVAKYDGTTAVAAGQVLPANQQVSSTPDLTLSGPSGHYLSDQVNKANYAYQAIPGDTGLTNSPCADAAVDVKMTEGNLGSFLTSIGPAFINKRTQVAAQTVSSEGVSPFVLPNISTPADTAVFVVAEGAANPAFGTDTILYKLGSCAVNAQPCLTSSNSSATWSATNVPVTFTGAPASLVVAKSTAPISASAVSGVTSGTTLATFCTSSGVSCYDNTDGTGLTYTRAYSTVTPNFPTNAPTVKNTFVSDPSTDAQLCKNTGTTGIFTGFIASSSACNVNVTANIDFGATESCADLSNTLNATLTLTASSGASTTLTCPSPGSSTAGSATGSWTTASTLAVPASAGPVTFGLTWKRTGGGSAVPIKGWETGGFTSGGNSGQCGSGGNACQSDFKIVQRVFTGAYDQQSAQTNPAGPVAGAAMTSGGSELMSVPTNSTVTVGVTIDFQALYDTPAGANGRIPNVPFTDIAYGTQQGNGLADCGQGVNSSNGPNGFDVQENAIAGLFTCNNYPVEPSTFLQTDCTSTLCPNTVPGGKFLKWLDGGLAAKIYGCPEIGPPGGVGQDGCASPMTTAACSAHPNYWSTQNQLATLEANSSDPRLISVMVTDAVNLKNGNTQVPVRHYAEFYVTGWTGDPCSGVNIGTGSSNGLTYVSEDVAPTDANSDIFFVGHFIKYFKPGATGSGSKCVLSSIDNCTLILTR